MPKRPFYKLLKKNFQVLAGLMLLIGHKVAAEPSETPIFYRVSLGGEPAGRLEVNEERTAELLTTRYDFEIQFQRAGQSLSLGMRSRFVETASGTPVEAWSWQQLGESPVETFYRFQDGGGMEIESRQGDNVVRRQLAPTPGWKPPAAAEEETARAIRAALAGGPKQFSITTMDPLLGAEPTTSHWELEAEAEELVLGGRSFKTSRWRQTQDLAPQLPSFLWLDAAGEIRRSRTELAGMEMLIEWTPNDPRHEKRPVTAGRAQAAAGPEVMVRTLLRADRPVPGARDLRRAVYEMRGEHLALPEAGYQRVEAIPGGLRVTVDLGSALEVPLDSAGLEPYLRPSLYLNHQDVKVRELHQQALAGEGEERGDPAARAEKLRRFVDRYLETKDLVSVLATASEVAANASGDCTEHAVLLAALLRAEGIASRVVFGLIYVESFAGEREVFGYHMWTQAYLGGRFVDLDATLAQPFDAAHITLGVSTLEEESSALTVMNNAMQNLSKASLHLIEPSAKPEPASAKPE